MRLRRRVEADFGSAGCLNLIDGDWAWLDRPVSNIGSIAVAGSGEPALLACFSIGVRRYGPTGYRDSITLPRPCGLVAVSFDGTHGVAADVAPTLIGFNAIGQTTFTLQLHQAPTSLALSALGDRAFCGFADGTVRCVQMPG